MKDGFVKTGAAIPSLRVADCTYNTEKIIELVNSAAEQGVKVLAFPELSITGYSCSDLFFRETLLKSAERSLVKIAEATADLDTLIFVGLPVRISGKIYNCAAVLFKGKILGIVPKTYLPNYGEFYEARQFTAAPEDVTDIDFAGQTCPFGTKLVFESDSIEGFAVAAEICEDVWAQIPPSVSHCMAGATVIVNLSASTESVGKPEYRRDLVKMHASRNLCAYIYASSGSGESTTDSVCSGHSFIYEGKICLAENPPFGDNELILTEIDVAKLTFERSRISTFVSEKRDGYRYIKFDTKVSDTMLTRTYKKRPFLPENTEENAERSAFILEMQARALAKRIAHTYSKKAVLGISGGLDSTLALLVAVRSMEILGRPASDVLTVTLPCFGTGKRTRGNAELLCEALGTEFKVVDIAASVKQHLADIGHDENTFDVTYENAQARERTQVLMDIANAVGGIVVGTGDLSEVALGWSTYNGDHMSMYGVNCTVPKTLIRLMVGCYADTCKNEKLAAVLRDILDTPISPELVPSKPGEMSQKTEAIIGDYDLHDFFLYYFIRFGFTPEKLFRIACITFKDDFDEEYIKKTLTTFVKRFFIQQFKRSCTPDGIKVGSVALSPRGDWRMPSDASFAVWMDNVK